MTTKLSTELITHWAYIEKEDKKFPLTKDQAWELRDILMQATTTKYIMIPDPKDPLWEPLWEWRAWNVVIKKIEARTDPDAYYVCDFWVKHPVSESCTDWTKYKVSPIVFRTALRSIYPQVQYSNQITPEMRTKVLYSLNP